MNDKEILENPTNRIVSVIDDPQSAEAAIRELANHGITDDDVRVAYGDQAAADVDTSAKWFADTDDEIEKYRKELEAGHIVISILVKDRAGRDTIHALLRSHNARHITHFGQWVTEMLR